MNFTNKTAAAIMSLSLLSTLTLAACGGSGSSVSTPATIATAKPITPVNPTPTPATSANPNSTGTLIVSVTIPKKAVSAASIARSTSGVRKPSYVTASVGSIVFTQTTGGATVTTLTVGGAACTPNVAGQLCTTTLVAPIGQDQWTIQTYASTDGSGYPISRGTLVKTIAAGTANAASLTLNPVVASLAFVPISASMNTTPAITTAVVLNALDTTGATIIGSTPFVDQNGNLLTIHLAPDTGLSGKNASTTAAQTLITNASANDLTTIAYDGLETAGTLNFTAWAPNITSAVFPVTLTAGSLTGPGGSVYIGSNGSTTGTLPVSEAGYAGAFTAVPNGNCASVITVGAAASNGPSTTFPITQVGAGTCTVVVSDNHGGSTTITVVSTTFAVTIS